MTKHLDTIRSRRSALGLAFRGAAAATLADLFPGVARADHPAPGTDKTNDVLLQRAAVCINLVGGNDSNNMIVPLEPTNFSAYSSGRGVLALRQSDLLSVNSPTQNVSYGFHPSLPELRDLYGRGRLAVVANVGLLNRPLTRDAVLSNSGLPDGLFHHEKAAYTSYLPNAIMMPPWAPKFQEDDPQDPQTQVYSLGGLSFLSPQRLHTSGPRANNPQVLAAMGRHNLHTTFPATQIGGQLQRIALLLQAGSVLKMKQPIFSASMAGFDTHVNESATQEELYRDLSVSMAAFYAATEEMGIADQVVTYTQTEFNRVLRPNKALGAEHGWGGHQLVMGGAVRGGDIYGTFPSLELGGPNDAGNDGIWIPTTANQQYEAVIARWQGAGNGDLSSAIDGLMNFPDGNLGFLV